MLALGERLDGGRNIFVLDTALTAKVLNVGELIDADGVLTIKGDAVEGFAGGEGLFGGFVLDEGVAVCRWGDQSAGRFTRTDAQETLPLGHLGGFVDGHEDVLWLGLADFAELLAQELDEFWFLVLGDDGTAVDNDEGVEAFVEPDFMLFTEI